MKLKILIFGEPDDVVILALRRFGVIDRHSGNESISDYDLIGMGK